MSLVITKSNLNYPRKDTLDLSKVPWAKPVAGEDFYNQRISERLAFSTKTKENYDKYQLWMRNRDFSSPIDFVPIAGHISPISRCNFKCTMCSVVDFKNGKRCEDMSIELFEKRLDELFGLIQISLVGLSELFMLHDSLEDMLKLCLDRKIWTNIATNGSLLHQRNWIERLADLNLDEIVVSIDGVTETTFESIRVGSNFKRVYGNAKNLNNQFDLAGVRPKRTKMQTVLQARNRHELFEFIPLARELGFSAINFETEPFDWGSVTWRVKNSKATEIFKSDELDALVSQGKEFGVEVGFVEIVQRYSALPNQRSLCSWPFSKIFISSDDRVVPCCHISNPDHFEIGNGIGENKSVVDVWNSEDYHNFRQSHVLGNIPDACRSCYK
jgi:pyrroloquinoline quinone biosynthesis protein E